MQITGMLHGARLLQFVGFPSRGDEQGMRLGSAEDKRF